MEVVAQLTKYSIHVLNIFDALEFCFEVLAPLNPPQLNAASQNWEVGLTSREALRGSALEEGETMNCFLIVPNR
jgi:hypothetical protein